MTESDPYRREDEELFRDADGVASAVPSEASSERREDAADEQNATPENEAVTCSDPELEQRIVCALQQIYDPEIPVNIYDLGLIYGIDIYPLGRVTIRLTLTSPACPVAGSLPLQVERQVKGVDGVSDASAELVWDPPWTMDMMSEDVKLELNLL